ncbi:integrase domain containing protein [Plakobranchus ocellatus]|uniref:Integrase domain containing protein n=1 Tax=Plakobranchus ocellatus TaxID=259542 RepID=A0AAV3ZLG2_9GAST|nr:integrase domain containing protein [Plakobranchus ocellatus]
MLQDSLSLAHGCLFYGQKVVIPSALQPQRLQILPLGHFGMQRMKQLARTAVYWPRIDTDIEDIARHCAASNEHQRLPPNGNLILVHQCYRQEYLNLDYRNTGTLACAWGKLTIQSIVA